jgi:hypothetical protein
MAPSKTLNAIYILLDIALLAAGAVCIAMSIVWRSPDVLRDLVINNTDLIGEYTLFYAARLKFTYSNAFIIAGLVLGIMFILTSIFGLISIFQRNHITMPLVALNWMLVVDALYVMVIATVVWFYSLRQRNEFYGVWKEQTSAIRTVLQDQVWAGVAFVYLRLLTRPLSCNVVVILTRQIMLYPPAFVKILHFQLRSNLALLRSLHFRIIL